METIIRVGADRLEIMTVDFQIAGGDRNNGRGGYTCKGTFIPVILSRNPLNMPSRVDFTGEGDTREASYWHLLDVAAAGIDGIGQ